MPQMLKMIGQHRQLLEDLIAFEREQESNARAKAGAKDVIGARFWTKTAQMHQATARLEDLLYKRDLLDFLAARKGTEADFVQTTKALARILSKEAASALRDVCLKQMKVVGRKSSFPTLSSFPGSLPKLEDEKHEYCPRCKKSLEHEMKGASISPSYLEYFTVESAGEDTDHWYDDVTDADDEEGYEHKDANNAENKDGDEDDDDGEDEDYEIVDNYDNEDELGGNDEEENQDLDNER